MEQTALRQRLGDILREEWRDDVNWEMVERMCESLYQSIDPQCDSACPHIVFHFLSDADIRAKNARYGQGQRVQIKRFVDTGECTDSKPIHARNLAIALAGTGALLFWLFR